MNLPRPINDGCGSNQIAQPPARNGIGLRKGAAGDGPVEHARQRCKIGVLVWCIYNMLIDLISDHEYIVPVRQVGDELQLIRGENLPGRIGWIA